MCNFLLPDSKTCSERRARKSAGGISLGEAVHSQIFCLASLDASAISTSIARANYPVGIPAHGMSIVDSTRQQRSVDVAQIVLTLSVRMIVVVAAMLSSIATARYLGPEGRGWFYFWFSLSALIIQFGNCGLHASNIYLLAKQKVPASILASNSMVAAIVASVAWTAVATLIALSLGHVQALDPKVIIPVFLLSATGLYFMLGANLFVAMGRLNEYNLAELLSKGISLVVLLIVVMVWRDPLLLLWGLGGAGLMVAIILTTWLRRHAPFVRPRFIVFRQGIAYGLRAYVIACLGALAARLNAFLLEPQLAPADYGAWSIAAQIFDVLTLVPASVALVILPRMMRSDRPLDILKTNALAVGIIMLMIASVFLAVGRILIVELYGPAFEPAFENVVWGIPGLIALAVTSILSQYMAAIGMPRLLIAVWVLIVLVQAGTAFVLIPAHGANGAMAALSLAYTVGLLLIFGLIYIVKDRNA